MCSVSPLGTDWWGGAASGSVEEGRVAGAGCPLPWLGKEEEEYYGVTA